MRVIISTSDKKAYKRAEKALQRQDIKFKKETQTIPDLCFWLEAAAVPRLRDLDGLKIEVEKNREPSFF